MAGGREREILATWRRRPAPSTFLPPPGRPRLRSPSLPGLPIHKQASSTLPEDCSAGGLQGPCAQSRGKRPGGCSAWAMPSWSWNSSLLSGEQGPRPPWLRETGESGAAGAAPGEEKPGPHMAPSQPGRPHTDLWTFYLYNSLVSLSLFLYNCPFASSPLIRLLVRHHIKTTNRGCRPSSFAVRSRPLSQRLNYNFHQAFEHCDFAITVVSFSFFIF